MSKWTDVERSQEPIQRRIKMNGNGQGKATGLGNTKTR